MYRYNFSDKNVNDAIRFLKGVGGKQAEPPFLKKHDVHVKNNKLFIDKREVIPTKHQVSFVRNKILSGEVPLARDSLYYFLQQKYINVPRAVIDKVLKAQNVVRESDSRQATTTRKKRNVFKKGQLSFDLIEIKFIDLPFEVADPDIEVEKGYFFSCADQLTGLSFFKWSPHKTQKEITPIAEECFKWFAEKLKLRRNQLVGFSDKGKEFDFKKYKSWGLRLKQLPRAPLIEMKNAIFQKSLYRIARMHITHHLKKLVEKAMNIVNNTKSKLTGKTPNEALELETGALSKKYNSKKRGVGTSSAVKKRPLQIGDMVRYALTPEKDKLEYKSYRPMAWSKSKYKVIAKRGNTYKINSPSGKRFIHRDHLKLTSARDTVSDKIIADRETQFEKVEIEHEEKVAAEVTDTTKKTKRGRPRRRAAVAGVKKRLKSKRAMRTLDKQIK